MSQHTGQYPVRLGDDRDTEAYLPGFLKRHAHASLFSKHVPRHASKYALSVLAGFLFALLFLHHYHLYSAPLVAATAESLAKPEGFPIVAVIFYGRREHVDVLDCYLRQNLVRNSGYLDHINFVLNTDDQADLEYIHDLVARVPEYSVKPANVGPTDWSILWKTHVTDSDTMYIKIDDDVTYLSSNAIPRLVHTLLKNPNATAVSANLINSPAGNWLHYHTGAIRPFLPKLNEDRDSFETSSWRPSQLPLVPSTAQIPLHYNLDAAPPFTGHTWQRLPEDETHLQRTPIAFAAYDSAGPGWSNWAVAAQQHYSLLANLEDGTTARYYLGDPVDGVWNMHYGRYSINTIAIWGRTVADADIPNDEVGADERAISIDIPKKSGRPFLVDSHALAAHFAFNPQQGGVAQTDLLRRYRNYANEMVCAPDNQKTASDFG